MSARTLLALFALGLLLVTPAAAEGDGIHLRTLPNGLRVVVKEDHSKPLAALRIYVGTGGCFEGEFLGCGISHYYEHLLSGGTTSNRTEEESARILREMGGQSNAYTRSDHTCYFIDTHKDYIGRAIDLYGDWMMHNVLKPEEVEREKGVILKEMNMGEDEPRRVLYKLFSKTMFRVHPIRIPTIGYRENFERLTRDDLIRYYRDRYAPNNTVVAIAGDVDPEAIFAQVERSMGAWERRPSPPVIIPAEPRQTAPRYAEVEMDVQQASVRMGWHTINLFHPDLYALDMVASVLSEGRSSRMVRRVVEQERLATEIFAYSLTPNYMSGTFGVLFQTPADKLDRTLEVVKEEVERIRKGPVSQEELDRARVQVVSQYQLALQEVANQAASVGANTLGTGDPRFSLKYVEQVQSVTPEQVVAAARKYLDPRGLTVAVVRPRGTGSRKSADGRAESAAVEIRREVLENGLTLLVKRTPGVSPVGIEAFSYGGLRAEPEGKNGVSFLTGRLLTRGTTSRSATDIASQVDAVGAQIQSRSGNNSIGLSLTLGRGRDDLPFAAELVADIFTSSTFPEEEFKKDKQIAMMLASRQDEEWQSEIYYLMRRELYGAHPYANPVQGSTTTLPGVTRDDVLAFAKKWIRPDGIVLAIAGDVEIESTLALFRKALAGWKAGEGAFTPPSPPELEWAERGLGKDRFIFKENQKQQAVLCFAFPGPGYFDLKDRAAMTVLDAFTSGLRLPSGWFHSALRGGDRSLVYFIHLSVFGGLDPGAVYVYTQTEPKLLKTVHDLMMEQLEKLRRGEYTDDELEIGRAMALVTTAYYGQKVGDVAAEVALSQLYGGTYDRLERYQEAIRAVTREDVDRVVDRYLKHMLVLVSGSPDVKKVVDEVGISR